MPPEPTQGQEEGIPWDKTVRGQGAQAPVSGPVVQCSFVPSQPPQDSETHLFPGASAWPVLTAQAWGRVASSGGRIVSALG